MIRMRDLIAPAFIPVFQDMKAGKHSHYWLEGGRGSTKSSFASLAIIYGMLRNPDANAIVYRRVAATLRESVYEQMIWAIDRMGLTAFFKFRTSPMEIRYKPTGQRILFRGADDPTKSKSTKLSKGYFAYLWFEELSEFSGMDAIRTIDASVIRGGGHAIRIYSYNPPQTAACWVNKEALKAKDSRYCHKSTYLDVPRAWLGEEFIKTAEELRQSDERAYRHMYLGEITGTGGNVFDNIEVREITDAEIANAEYTYCGLDFGWFPDPTRFVRCEYRRAARELMIYAELSANRTGDDDLYELLVNKMGVTYADEIIADSADQKAIAGLRYHGLNIIGAMKGPGSVRAGVKWLQSLKKIIIDPARCPKTAEEFTTYEYERAADGSYVDAMPDRNNHSIDAVRYAMNRVWMEAGS